MTQRVKLTAEAAARFPDLAGRTGTVLERGTATRVKWDANPGEHDFAVIWHQNRDLDPVTEGVGMTTTPPTEPETT